MASARKKLEKEQVDKEKPIFTPFSLPKHKIPPPLLKSGGKYYIYQEGTADETLIHIIVPPRHPSDFVTIANYLNEMEQDPKEGIFLVNVLIRKNEDYENKKNAFIIHLLCDAVRIGYLKALPILANFISQDKYKLFAKETRRFLRELGYSQCIPLGNNPILQKLWLKKDAFTYAPDAFSNMIRDLKAGKPSPDYFTHSKPAELPLLIRTLLLLEKNWSTYLFKMNLHRGRKQQVKLQAAADEKKLDDSVQLPPKHPKKLQLFSPSSPQTPKVSHSPFPRERRMKKG